MNAAAALATVDSANLAKPAPLTFAVPLAQTADYAGLSERRRNEVKVTLLLLERVHALRGPQGVLQTACETVAASAKSLMSNYSDSTLRRNGCSASTLRRKYEAYLGAKGDWRVLVKGYKGPKTTPPAFNEYVKKLAEDNQRSMAQAFELLKQQWRVGHPIPGYGTWMEYFLRQFPAQPLPKTCPSSLIPSGWGGVTGRTLYRKASNKGARMLFQRGIAAAKKFFPSVIRDTSALRPMEYIAIDDFELDCLCVFHGDENHAPEVGEVAGLLALDVGTRKKLHWGIGQKLTRTEMQKDGSVKKIRTGIARLDVQLFLHGLFEKYGLPEYTVTIICENATASISPELELAFTTLFEGRVRVERTGLIDHKTLTNGFAERGGKPWEKGWIEAAFNGLWNILGATEGYKGSNQRLNGPADIDAKIAYTKLLIGQGEGKLNLPPEKIVLLRAPFPSIQTLENAFAWAVATHDTRTNHKYQGFEPVTEYQLSEGTDPVPFLALATLSPEQQLAVKPVERMQSALERWVKLGGETVLRPIPAAALAILLLTPKKVTYRNHAISFTHDKKGYSYIDKTGRVLGSAQDGTEFLAFFNPRNPAQLHVTTLQGALVGTLDRLGGARGAIDIRDRKALREEADTVQTIIAGQLAQIRERHADQDAQLALDRAHNASIVAEHKAVTAVLTTAEKVGLAAGAEAQKQIEDKTQAKKLSRAGSDAEALLGDESEPQKTAAHTHDASDLL